jgi:hypothetical protein
VHASDGGPSPQSYDFTQNTRYQAPLTKILEFMHSSMTLAEIDAERPGFVVSSLVQPSLVQSL